LKVELSKEECEYLSLAMDEAVAQADAELAVTKTKETLTIRHAFATIKAKMDLAILEAE
jgi:hypothetical protein